MKEKLKNSPVLEKWFYTQSPLVITRPALRETALCLLHLLGGFVLSCGRLLGQPAPFALGLLSATGGGIRGLCTLIGAAAGFLTMQPFSQGLQLTSTAILVFVTMYIFGSLWVTKRLWFHCLVSALMSGAVGAIFLVSSAITSQLLEQYGALILLSGLSPAAFSPFLQGKWQSAGGLFAMCFFLIGTCVFLIPPGICLGCVMAVALSAVGTRRGDLGTGAALAVGAGLSMDISMVSSFSWTLLLGASVLLGCVIPRKYPLLRTAGFAAGFWTGAFLLGADPFILGLSFGAGLLLSLLLPAAMITGREDSAIAQSSALVEERLSYGQEALDMLYDTVGMDPTAQADQERLQIFDKATRQVCRQCLRYHSCWDKNAHSTYVVLHNALGSILARGEAVREDFPEDFARDCRHMEGLLVALNQELTNIACRSQYRSRTEENRLIVSRSLLHISRMLEENARQLRSDQRLPREAYAAKVGVCARGRKGVKLSGDRGMCLHTEDGMLYTIVCDGVGTGEEAAKESQLAINTLSALLQSGMPPQHAMELLNGVYVLRDSGTFSTMDVLELSLLSGQGTLYKWGAAPSYIKSGDMVNKVGTAGPPPGLGVGSTGGAEIIRLSLWGGDMLILASDGVTGEETEALIRSYEGDNVKELSNLLVSKAQELGGEDDMTVAVIRLEELRK